MTDGGLIAIEAETYLALRAEVRRLREVLGMVEWVEGMYAGKEQGYKYFGQQCPWCAGNPMAGHAPDCPWVKAGRGASDAVLRPADVADVGPAALAGHEVTHG